MTLNQIKDDQKILNSILSKRKVGPPEKAELNRLFKLYSPGVPVCMDCQGSLRMAIPRLCSDIQSAYNSAFHLEAQLLAEKEEQEAKAMAIVDDSAAVLEPDFDPINPCKECIAKRDINNLSEKEVGWILQTYGQSHNSDILSVEDAFKKLKDEISSKNDVNFGNT